MRPTRRGIIFAHVSRAFARLFVSWCPCHFTQFTAPDRSGPSRRNGLVWLSDHPVAPRTTVGSSRSAEPGSRPGHLADSNLYRVRTIVGSPCGTMPKPSSIYSATPNLTRTRTLLRRLTWVPPPRHHPEAIARRPKTKNRLELQLFCDWRLLWAPPIADRGAKAQVIGCSAAYFRFRGIERSP